MFRYTKIFVVLALVAACGDNNLSLNESPRNKVTQGDLDAFNKLPKPGPVHCFSGQYWDELRRECFEHPRRTYSATHPTSPPDITDLKSLLGVGQAFQCQVGFSVDLLGQINNIRSHCSDSSLNDEVRNAIGKLEYAPLVIQGKAEERPAITCCIEGESGSDGADAFYCMTEIPYSGVCKRAPEATQD